MHVTVFSEMFCAVKHVRKHFRRIAHDLKIGAGYRRTYNGKNCKNVLDVVTCKVTDKTFW